MEAKLQWLPWLSLEEEEEEEEEDEEDEISGFPKMVPFFTLKLVKQFDKLSGNIL